eukprot:373484-Rhodomonas_salina.1
MKTSHLTPDWTIERGGGCTSLARSCLVAQQHQHCPEAFTRRCPEHALCQRARTIRLAFRVFNFSVSAFRMQVLRLRGFDLVSRVCGLFSVSDVLETSLKQVETRG